MIFQEVFSPADEMPELTEERANEMREKYEVEGPQLPPIERSEPGFWSGMGEGIYRGTASGALKSMSFAETAIANTGLAQSARNMAQIETGETFDQIDVSDVQQRLERDAKQYREIAKRDFAADPSTMGTAAQILYGVFETIPKAVAYSTIAGPAGGSVLFGADLGVGRAQELMDEGVDQNTATWAGIATFGMSALGMRVPAVFGKSRIASATIGAVVNAGLTAAETQSVNWILQNQNYTELAERYRLNPIDLITSAVFGGVMGGVLWRARPDVSANQADVNARPALNDQLYNQLREASPAHITDEQVRYQADLHAVGIGALASKADIDPYAIAPEIVRSNAIDGFDQPITQGREWHMGIAKLMPDDELDVLSYEPSSYSRQESIDLVRNSLSNGVRNQDTGFILTASSSDIKKSVGAIGSEKEKVFNYVAPHITEIAQKAKLLESHADVQHRNDEVQGIHIFGQPVLFGDALYRVQLIVRDYVIPNQERTAVHSIDGIEIERIENPPPETSQLEGGSSAIESSASSVKTGEPPAVPDNLKITVSRFLSDGNRPYIRSDGRGFFDPIDDSSYSDGGAYFEGSFNQRAWHGSPFTFDSFSTDNIGSGTGRSTHGWGLYFTKDKKVAENYRDKLGGDSRLYEVEVPEDDVLLDSNAPYAEQPQKVREAINMLYEEQYGDNPPPDWWSGREVYQDIILREEGYANLDEIPGDYEMDMDLDNLAGNSRLASEKLNSIGVRGAKFLGDDGDTGFVVFDDNAIQTIDFYQRQTQAGVTRGSFNPALNRITLTANADISTFSHEMGHFYLTDMFELSKLPAAANSTLKEDVDILLKEWGIRSLREWDELGVEGQRKYHEQFASWVEDYLTKGQSPIKELQRLFERMAQWICDVYRTVSLSKRYKDEFGIELPPPSKEVQKVLDRLFREDKKIQKAKQSVNKTQVAAARMVQANRTNENRLDDLLAMPEGPKKTKLMRDQMRSYEAQAKVLKQMLRGQVPDAYEEVKDIDFNSVSMKEARGNFGRAYVMGNTDSVVILQNRDRSDTASQGQMNSIAANPRYGLVSVSRDYAGAPVISYGQAPDNAHLGNSDFIYESNGNRVPFVYAVVEASDVETSNFINGGTNNAYGDKNRWNAVIGNGRMTGLKEAYNRGTASEYRRELEADKGHGISPDVIKAMENPVLVRVINPEDVTTGLISRSNASQVMERDDVEVAFEDAPKIRARAGSYEFDEAGNPTRDTLVTFIQDINDTNALGRLITSDGRPTPEAVRRIRNAVFFEAYQSPELSALFSQEVDPGIRRVLNGLANVAPRIIELREQAQELDFSNLLVEAANRIRQARLNPEEGADFASQMSFLDNPATSAFVEFLNDNANSAAAIARTLNPLIDWAENAARAAEGDDLLGGFEAPHIDLADVVGRLRNIINEDRLARNLEPLPEINIEDVRSAINSANDMATRAVEAAAPVRAKMEAQQAMDAEVVNQANEDLAVKRELSEKVLDPDTQQEAMMELFADQVPDREYTVLDDLGQEKNGTAQQLLAEAELGVIKAQQDRLGIGRVTECLIRNQGV